MKSKALKTVAVLMVLFSAAIYISGCTKTKIKLSTTDDVNIVGYLDRYPDSFSLFKQILVRTETDAFLNAYGSYTCFAVTNSGVQRWLDSMHVPSVNAADPKVLMDMVKFHLLNDTVNTSAFTDGKLPSVTMYGEYLITGVAQRETGSGFLINRQGFVLQSNIRVGNGVIHVIDNVLVPAKLTLAKQLEANPDYSIFLEAVKTTGYYDLLNTINSTDSNKRWITLIAESNAALADSGIYSFADLQAKYGKGNEPKSPKDTLNLYVQYHISYGLKFLGDIVITQSQATLAPQEILTIKLIDKDIYINDDDFNGVHEPGIRFQRASSDVQATNGVLHNVKSHFNIKLRKPFAVYWDVADQPEYRKLPALFRKGAEAAYTSKISQEDRPFKDIDWEYKATNGLKYAYYNNDPACYADYLIIRLGGPNRPSWMNFKTPLLVKGKYKVWVCYRRQQGSGSVPACLVNVLIDGVPLQRPFDFISYIPSGTDGEREAIYYKRYTESTSTAYVSRLVGIVDIATTDRHIFRMEAVVGSQDVDNLDMVHYLPVDQNQILPRFKSDGSQLFL